MGIGYWFTEKVAYDKESGEQLTTSTWVSLPKQLISYLEVSSRDIKASSN